MHSQLIVVQLIITLVFYLWNNVEGKNNVCYTDRGYDDLSNSKACYYNPDLELTTPEIIKFHGYPLEIHTVITDDGYIVTLFRIPHDNKKLKKPRQPIFLLQGVFQTASVWVDKGNRSLAFYLVENGYDVWLGTFRGTINARGHVNLTADPLNLEYWNFSRFSLHHIGVFDLSAEIKYVADKTGNKGNIIYIGHSMGGTVSFIYASVKKQEAEKYLKGIVSLAPAMYLHNSPLLKRIAKENRQDVYAILKIVRNAGIGGLFSTDIVQKLLLQIVHFGGSRVLRTIRNILKLGGEAVTPKLSSVDLLLYIATVPDAVAVNVLENYVQFFEKRRPVGYDFGEEQNLCLYGSKTPIVYKVSNIKIPVHIFYGGNDQVDIKLLYLELKTNKSLTHITEDRRVIYSHISFVYGGDIVKNFYVSLLKKLQLFN